MCLWITNRILVKGMASICHPQFLEECLHLVPLVDQAWFGSGWAVAIDRLFSEVQIGQGMGLVFSLVCLVDGVAAELVEVLEDWGDSLSQEVAVVHGMRIRRRGIQDPSIRTTTTTMCKGINVADLTVMLGAEEEAQ